MARRRDRSPPHGIIRDRVGQITVRRKDEAAVEGRLPPGSGLVMALLVPFMVLLVDRTGQGTHAAHAGRDHYGRELHLAASRPDRTWRGKVRDRFSVRTVARVHRILVALDLIRVVWRYDVATDTYLPALRWLSDSLLEELGGVARERAPKRAKAPTAEELERRRRQSEEAALAAAGVERPADEAAEAEPVERGEHAGRARDLLDRLRRGPP